jgi:hypothetical protein
MIIVDILHLIFFSAALLSGTSGRSKAALPDENFKCP